MVRAECTEKLAVLLDENAGIEVRDCALYWLIACALRPGMERRFRPYEGRVPFTFEDSLQEYFLYLRGDGPEYYSVLRKLKDRSSADSWLLSTFRNFLSRQSRDSAQSGPTTRRDISNIASESDQETQRITMLSTIISYCYQELPLVQRFVLLRMILSALDKDRALPQKDVAMVLGISHVYYRVLGNRVKSFMMQAKERLLQGEDLHLDSSGLSFQKAMERNAGGWYDLIAEYYSKTIDLFAQSAAINALRCSYRTSPSASILHDTEKPYLTSSSPPDGGRVLPWHTGCFLYGPGR